MTDICWIRGVEADFLAYPMKILLVAFPILVFVSDAGAKKRQAYQAELRKLVDLEWQLDDTIHAFS